MDRGWGRTLALIGVCAALLGACTPTSTTSPSSAASSSAVLSIENRGGPPIVVTAGLTEIARVSCGAVSTVAAGGPSLPPLPWNLVVRTASDRTILLTSTVSALPEWLVLIGSDAQISSTPIGGPSGPPCPSSF